MIAVRRLGLEQRWKPKPPPPRQSTMDTYDWPEFWNDETWPSSHPPSLAAGGSGDPRVVGHPDAEPECIPTKVETLSDTEPERSRSRTPRT